MIAGRKIDIYDKSLSSLKKRFENEKAVVLRDEKGIRPDLILRDWYKEWFEKCKSPQLKTDLSRAAYNRKCSNTFVRILGDKRVEDITQLNVQMAANQLHEETYSEKVIYAHS